MKYKIMATVAFAGAFAFAGGAVAQTGEPLPDPSLANPTASTSALYKALGNGLRISQGANLDTIPTLGSMEALGYLLGVKELLSVYITQQKFRICVPAGVGADALERVVVKYIDGNPKSYGWPPGAVVTAAYVQAFPCGK
jgi:hypothetical protein